MLESKNNLVSFIMPVYNSAEFLSHSIQSILNQSYENFELLIIYDKSNDSSLEIINKYIKDDSRIKIIKGLGQGLSSALNQGIEKSNGDFIARIDADDVCHHDRLQKQIPYIKEHQLDICGTQALLIDKRDRIIGAGLYPVSHEACTLTFSISSPFLHPTVIIRKSFLDKHSLRYGQSEYQAAEDYDLWIRANKLGAKYGNINEALLNYRVLESSASRNNSAMLNDSRVLSDSFFKINYKECREIFINLIKNGSSFEKNICVKFLIKSFLKKGKIFDIKYLRYVEFKIIIFASMSQIYSFFKR